MDWVAAGKAGRLNARRFDIYVTPIDPDHHYILIDDMPGLEAVKALRREGYRPALVQRSSHGNFQVILKIKKDRGSELEQRAANKLVQKLNKKHGDPKVSGALRPFRLAGFRNKKTGRDDALTEIDWGLSSPGVICPICTADLASERKALLAETQSPAAPGLPIRVDSPTGGPADAQRYSALMAKLEKIFGRTSLDLSAADFRTVQTLLAEGWSPARITEAMRQGSPGLTTRHQDVDRYIERTLDAARERLRFGVTRPRRVRPPASVGPSITP